MKKPQILPSRKHHPWHHFFITPCSLSPKTLSFRHGNGDFFRTVNSVYFDDPCFTASASPSTPSAASFTTEDDGAGDISTAEETVETVVRGVRSSERLFFDPDETRSILGFPFKESSEVLAMESEDPYGDFRRSMEEMVESHGIKEWEDLEELLGWYLKVNGKNNHVFIVEAFVDLLVSITNKKEENYDNKSVSLTSPSTLTTTSNYSSAISSFSSSISSLQVSTHSHEEEEEALNEIVVVDDDDEDHQQ